MNLSIGLKPIATAKRVLEIREWLVSDLPLFKTKQGEEIDRLQKENDDLRAHVERFREYALQINDNSIEGIADQHLALARIVKLAKQTPKQSLAEMEARTIREASDAVIPLDNTTYWDCETSVAKTARGGVMQ